MRLPVGRTILAGVAGAGLWLGALGCNDSNDVAGPTTGTGAASANVAGDWSGTYQSDTPALCTGSTATARFSQQGTRVTGTFQAMGCGINGSFHGSISGTTLTGTVDLAGCTGGGVTGTVSESGITLQVGEFRKTLLAGGPTEVMAGGRATLTR
jgi:hypothetical protein